MANDQNRTVAISSPRMLADWQPPLELTAWKIEEPRPPSLTNDELERTVAILTTKTTPATVQEYARAMMALIEFGGAFGVPCGSPEAVQAIYRETLADLPAELLHRAVARIKSGWTWGNRMPFPAEIRATVADDLAVLRSNLAKARIALRKPAETEKKNVISAEKWRELRDLIRAGSPSNREA